ncbi:DNA polymerase III subunit delta [Vibrio sp. SCSIO 43137]|uniref:DNA polymerase III subunit delta n=1 Tax=Vibrio sp. SCSIO 43137 TaxID=3021011 RepID=UPI0023080262|nr:DNA polymerase III subunit delta [Vibrio sp. SCSIO 43137]WCE29037.1 DNA polymerase III subunit delta [Vibrio sp. SCSIO 43137]
MRVFADKLADHLSRQLKQIYLVFGNEPLLLQESRDAIIEVARSNGFLEKQTFSVDNSLNWNEVFECCNTLSLFSSRQIIELEVPENGINAAASKSLLELSEQLNPDILLLICGQKLTRQQENAKWFKSLNQSGIWVSCLTPDIQRLPQFVQSRCRQLNLVPDREALQMLAQWHEGNLLALKQSLDKLALLYPDGQLTLLRVEQALSRHNHYTPFQWMDALLAGKAHRAQRILNQLEQEGVEPVILIRTLQKELQLLITLKSESATVPAGQLFDKFRIWQNKRPLYNASLQRLSVSSLKQLIGQLGKAEILVKTQYDQSCWPLLSQISLQFCSASAPIAGNYPIHS